MTISNLELCGIQNWTDPTDHYRYLVFCYKTSRFSGSIQSSDEGEVFWIDREDLRNVQLADGEPMKELYKKFDNSIFLCYSRPRNEREVLKWKQSLIHIFVTT